MKTAIIIICTGLLATACSISTKYHGVHIDTRERTKDVIIKD
jgi:hypothetical protein